MEESKISVIQIPEKAVAEDQRTDKESVSTSLHGTHEKPEIALDENEDFIVTLNATVRENVREFLESVVLKSEMENLNDTLKEKNVNLEHEAELQISGDSSCNFNVPEVNDENIDASEVNNSNQTNRDNKPGVSKDKIVIIEEIVNERTNKPGNITEIIHDKPDIAQNENTEERLKDKSVSEKNFESIVLSSDNEIDGSSDGCGIADTFEPARDNSQMDITEEVEKTKSSEGTLRKTSDTGNEGEAGYITIKNSGKTKGTLGTADLSDIISKGEMAEHEEDDILATKNELANNSEGNDGSLHENTNDVFQGDNKFQNAAISNKISTQRNIGPEPNKELTLKTDYDDFTRAENCVCGNEEPNRVFQDDDNNQNLQPESFCGDEYDGNKARTKSDITSDNVYFGDNDCSAVSEVEHRTKRESPNEYDERSDIFEIRDIKHSVEISKMVPDSTKVIAQKYSGDNTTNVSEYPQDNIDNKSATINEYENIMIGLDRIELPEEKSFMSSEEGNTQSRKSTDSTNNIENGELEGNLFSVHTPKTETLQYILSKDGTDVYSTEFSNENVVEDQDDDFPDANTYLDKTERTSQQQNVPRDTPVDIQVTVLTDSSNGVKIGCRISDKSTDTSTDIVLDPKHDGFLRERNVRDKFGKSPIRKVAIPDIDDNIKDYLEYHFTEAGDIKRDVSYGSKEMLDFDQRIDSNSGEKQVSNGKTKNDNKSYSNGESKTICTAVDGNEEKQLSDRNFIHPQIRHSAVLSEYKLSTILDNACNISKHTPTFSSQTASNAVLEYFDMQSVQIREISKSNISKGHSNSYSYIEVPKQRELHNEVKNYKENESAENGYPEPAEEWTALNPHSSHEDLNQGTLQDKSNEHYQSEIVFTGHQYLIDTNHEDSNGINIASKTDQIITESSYNQQRNTNQTCVNNQEVDDKGSYSIQGFSFDRDDTNIYVSKEIDTQNTCDKPPFPNIEREICKQKSKSEVCKSNMYVSTHDVRVGVMEETSLNEPWRIPIAITESHNNKTQLLARENNMENIGEKVDEPERKLDYYFPDQGMDTKDGKSIVDDSAKITDDAEEYLPEKLKEVLAQNKTWQSENMNIARNEQIYGKVIQDNANGVSISTNRNEERKNTYGHAFAISNWERQEVRSNSRDVFKCDDCATIKLEANMENVSNIKSEGIQSSNNDKLEETLMSNDDTASAEVQCDTNDELSVLDTEAEKYICSDNDSVRSKFKSGKLLEVHNSTVQQKFQSDIEIDSTQNSALVNMNALSRPKIKDGREFMEDTEVTADEMHKFVCQIMVIIDENKGDTTRDTFSEKEIFESADSKRRNIDDKNPYEIYKEMEQYETLSSNAIYVHSFCTSYSGQNCSVVSTDAYVEKDDKQKPSTEELAETTESCKTSDLTNESTVFSDNAVSIYVKDITCKAMKYLQGIQNWEVEDPFTALESRLNAPNTDIEGTNSRIHPDLKSMENRDNFISVEMKEQQYEMDFDGDTKHISFNSTSVDSLSSDDDHIRSFNYGTNQNAILDHKLEQDKQNKRKKSGQDETKQNLKKGKELDDKEGHSDIMCVDSSYNGSVTKIIEEELKSEAQLLDLPDYHGQRNENIGPDTISKEFQIEEKVRMINSKTLEYSGDVPNDKELEEEGVHSYRNAYSLTDEETLKLIEDTADSNDIVDQEIHTPNQKYVCDINCSKDKTEEGVNKSMEKVEKEDGKGIDNGKDADNGNYFKQHIQEEDSIAAKECDQANSVDIITNVLFEAIDVSNVGEQLPKADYYMLQQGPQNKISRYTDMYHYLLENTAKVEEREQRGISVDESFTLVGTDVKNENNEIAVTKCKGIRVSAIEDKGESHLQLREHEDFQYINAYTYDQETGTQDNKQTLEATKHNVLLKAENVVAEHDHKAITNGKKNDIQLSIHNGNHKSNMISKKLKMDIQGSISSTERATQNAYVDVYLVNLSEQDVSTTDKGTKKDIKISEEHVDNDSRIQNTRHYDSQSLNISVLEQRICIQDIVSKTIEIKEDIQPISADIDALVNVDLTSVYDTLEEINGSVERNNNINQSQLISHDTSQHIYENKANLRSGKKDSKFIDEVGKRVIYPFYSEDDEEGCKVQYQKQYLPQNTEQTSCELKSGAQGKAMTYEGQEHNFSPQIIDINDLERDGKMFAEESRDGIPILAEGDGDEIPNQFRTNDDSINIYEIVGECRLGVKDKALSLKTATRYIFPDIENITTEHGYTTFADGTTNGIQLSEKVEIDDDIQFLEQYNHKGIDETTTVLQPGIDDTAFIYETIDETVTIEAKNADGLMQDNTKITEKLINETYLLVQDVNDATRIENTIAVDSLNLNKLTDEQQFSVYVCAKSVESTKQNALNEEEIIDSSPHQALTTNDSEINMVHVLANKEMEKRNILVQNDAKNINIAMSELPIGRQDGVSDVEIIKQIASSEFANMNGLEKRDNTMLDNNSKEIDFSVDNGISTNGIQSTLAFDVNKTNVQLQIEIKDSTSTFKAAKQINSLEAAKIRDVTNEITNISDPTAVNFHLYMAYDNYESTVQHTTHAVSLNKDKNKDVLQTHMKDRASASEGSKHDFATEAEQTEDSGKVDTTVVEGIEKEIKASTKIDCKSKCIQCISSDDLQTQNELQLCTNNIIYSVQSTNPYASPGKVEAANKGFIPEVNHIIFMKKDDTKLTEGVGDEIQSSKSDNRETFIQKKTQEDSQNLCETDDKATKHDVPVTTENVNPSEQDEVTKTDELPEESKLSLLDNKNESKTQSMTMNDFKSIHKAINELHLGILSGPNNFETTKEDVPTKEKNNTSGQGNTSIVDGNTAEAWILGTDNCDANGTRFVIEYNFKNIDKDEMKSDVQGSANNVKETKHDVYPEFEVNVSNIKQDAPLGLQADAKPVMKTEVDISIETIDGSRTVEGLILGQDLKKDHKGNSGEHSLGRSLLLSHNDTYSGLEIQAEKQTDLSKIGDDMKGLESVVSKTTEKVLESDTEKKVIISTIEENVCDSEKTQASNSNPNEENYSLHETPGQDFSKNKSDLNEKGLETTDLTANLEIVSFYQISKDTHTVIHVDSQYVHETTQLSSFNDNMDIILHKSELFETDLINAVNNSCEHFYPTPDAGFNGVHEENTYFALLSENEENNRNCKDDNLKMQWSKQTRKSSLKEKARDKQYRNTENKTELADYYLNTDVYVEQPAETYKNKLKITRKTSTDTGTTKTYILQGVEETGKEQQSNDFSVELEELSQSEQTNATNLDDKVAGCNRIVRTFLSTDESNVNVDIVKIDDFRTEGSGGKYQNERSEDVRSTDKMKYPKENRKVNKSELDNCSESIDNENVLQAINNSKPDTIASDETDNKGAGEKVCFTISISGHNIAGDGEKMIATNEKSKNIDANDENNQYTAESGTEIFAETIYIYSRERKDNDIHHEAQNNVSPKPTPKNGNYGGITASADPGLITTSIHSIVTDYLKASDEIIQDSKTRFEKLSKDEPEAAEGRDSTQDKKYATENSDELSKDKTDERSKGSANQVNIIYNIHSDTGGKKIPENSAKILDGKAKEETKHFDISNKTVQNDLQTQSETENMSYLIETKAIVIENPDNREEIKYVSVTVEQSSTERAQHSWSLVQPETIGTSKSTEKDNYEDINDAKNIGDTNDENIKRSEKIEWCSHDDFQRIDPNDQESERKEEYNTKHNATSYTANQSPHTAAAAGTTTINETFIKAITHNENNRQTCSKKEKPPHLIQKDSVVEEHEYVYVTKMCDPLTFEDNTGQAGEIPQVHTVTSDDEIGSSNRTNIDQKTVKFSCNLGKATKELDLPDEQIQVKETVAENKEESTSGEFYLTDEDEMIVNISEGEPIKIENNANAEEKINLYVPSYVPNKEQVSYETNYNKRSTKSVGKGNREAAMRETVQVDGDINSIYKDKKKISDKEIIQNDLYVRRKREDITETASITMFSNNIDVTTNDKLLKDVSYEEHNDPTFKKYINLHGITLDKLAKKKDEVSMTSKNTTETMSEVPTRWNTLQEISDGNYQLQVEINSQNVDEATTQRSPDQLHIETDHDINNCKGFKGSSQTASISAQQISKELDIRNENGDTMYKKAMDTYYNKIQFVTEMTTTPVTTQGERKEHLIDETIKRASHYKNESQYSSAAFVHSEKNHHVYNANSNATAVEISISDIGNNDSVKPELNEPCVSNNVRVYESQSANNVEIDNTLSVSKKQDDNDDVPFAIVDKELLFNTEKPIHDISHQNNSIDYDSSSQSKSKHSVNNRCQSAKPHEEIKSLNITRYGELESGEIFDPRVNVSLYVNGDLSDKIPHENGIERQPTTEIIIETTKLIKGAQSTESNTTEEDKKRAKDVNHMENGGQGTRDNRILGDKRVGDTNVLSHDQFISVTQCKGICEYSGECEQTLLSLQTSTLTEHPHIASESKNIVHNMISNISEMKSKPSMNITVPYVEDLETVETKEAKYFPCLSAVSRIVESSLLGIRSNDSLKRFIVKTSNEIQYESIYNLLETTGTDYPQNVGVHSMLVERADSIVSNESLATNEVIRSNSPIFERYTQTSNDVDDECETQPNEYKSALAEEGVQILEEGLDKCSIDSNNSINHNEMHKTVTTFRSTQNNVREKERKMSKTESPIQQLSEDIDMDRKSTDYIGMKIMDGNARFVAATFSKPSSKLQGNQNQQTSENIEDIDSETLWRNREAKDVDEETNDTKLMLLNDDIDYRKTHQKYADPDRRCKNPKEEPSNEQEKLIFVYHATEEGNIPEDSMVREIGKDYMREITLNPLENGIPDILQNNKSENDDTIEKSTDESKMASLQNCTSTSKEIPISKIKNDEPSKSLPSKLLSLVKILKKTHSEETEMQHQYMSCLKSLRENIKRGLEVSKPIRCDDERYDSESEYSTDTCVIYDEDDCPHSICQDEYYIGFEKSPDNDKYCLSRNRDRTVDGKGNQTEVKRFGVSFDNEVLESGRKVKNNILTRYKEETERDVDKQMEINEDEEEQHVRERQEFSDIITYRDENEKLNKTNPFKKKSTEGTVIPSGSESTVSEKDTKTHFGSGMRKDTDGYMPKYHPPKRNPKIDSKWPSNHPAYHMLYRKQLSPRKLNIGALPHLKNKNINDKGKPPSPTKTVEHIHRCGAAFLPPIHHPTHPDTLDDIPKAKQYLEYLHNHPISSISEKTKGPLRNRRKEDISMSLPNLSGKLSLSPPQIHQKLLFDPQPPTSSKKRFSAKELAEMEEYLELTHKKTDSPGKRSSSKQADLSHTFSIEDMVEIIQLRKTFYLGNREEKDEYREHRIHQIFRELQEIRKKTEEGKDILIIRKGIRPRSGRNDSDNSKFIILDYSQGEIEKMKTDEDLRKFICDPLQNEMSAKKKSVYRNKRRQRAYSELKDKLNQKYSRR